MMKSTSTLNILVALQTVEVQCDTLPTVVHQNSSEVCPSETKQQASLDELKGRIQVTLMHISPAIHFPSAPKDQLCGAGDWRLFF